MTKPRKKKKQTKDGMDIVNYPPPFRKKKEGEEDVNFEGEASWIKLDRFEGETKLSGRMWNFCCDCNLCHLLQFQVWRDPGTEEYWLIKRAYRLPDELLRDSPAFLKKRKKLGLTK